VVSFEIRIARCDRLAKGDDRPV